MDRGSNESGRVWNILWQRESTLSPFTYQKVLCRRRTLTKTFDETSSTTWTVAVLDRNFGSLTMEHFGSGLRHKNGWSTSVRKDDRTEVCFIAAESRLTLIKGLSSPRLEFMAALLRSRLIIYAKRELAMSIPHSDRCVESAFAINYG
ncbi:hypothetical protein T03_18158 [Trichinella britovi]|uniref:Uncharacterized protein n=1 Tax=Trichinella britovi TaxID=45882 RepID=A0A0V1DCX9_TRIBR|nr:hypothetical protein T03_18158 [Trichinella britovi]